MTPPPEADTLAVGQLGPRDLAEVFALLDRDPVLNVYLLALALRDALGRPHDEFWGARRDGELVALVLLGRQSGAVMPLGEDETALRLLGGRAAARLDALPRRFQVVGSRAAVAAFLESFERGCPPPRLRRSQIYMALERGRLAPFARLRELRQACREDYDLVFESGARLRAEELEEDPREADPAAYARRVEEECRDGYTWLWVDCDGLCFRAGVSALTPDAAQVAAVYTPAARRDRGLARRGLSELCARLFERSRIVCLFVNDFNAPALAVYRHIGFVERAPWASAFFDLGR